MVVVPGAWPLAIPSGSIVATARRFNDQGQAVFAQGVTVSISGPKSGTAPTGWGDIAGKAKFYDLPPGNYTVTWNGRVGYAAVVLGQTAYVDLGP